MIVQKIDGSFGIFHVDGDFDAQRLIEILGSDYKSINQNDTPEYLNWIASKQAEALDAQAAKVAEALKRTDRMTTLRNTVADNRDAPTLPKLQAQVDAMMAVIEDLQNS